MKRNFALFLATFAVGAIIAFAARAALHEPHAATTATAHVSPGGAPLVNNALTPARGAVGSGGAHTAPAPNSAAPTEHASHTPPATAAKTEAASTPTVNTRCAICGMPVDPTVATVEYQGKKIGFGCKLCAPKFKADPDKYGPIYLRNEVIER
jgi:YHS domain-containing protein